jgi:uncharacterized protein YuzE
MATRTIKGTLDNFSVDAGAEITYLGNTSAGSTGGLNIRGFRVNPTTTGDITVKVAKSSGVVTMEIFQEDAYTASNAPTGYTKYSNIAKNGKDKGAVGVTVTDASKNYVVLLELDGYSEVSYVATVDVP